jgi:hypothetical protein
MDEPFKVPFDEFPWADDAPGIRARETDVGAPLGGGGHRGRNLAPGLTRLFLIDDVKA